MNFKTMVLNFEIKNFAKFYIKVLTHGLVTGGLGFIGSHLIDRLINLGDYVICLDDISSEIKEI